METDKLHFKELLETELLLLEKELGTLGRKNPDHSTDWEATEEAAEDTAEEGDVAEGLAKQDDDRNTLDELEVRLNEVKKALEKIDSDEYGFCEVCDVKIETDRLEANPAAATCKAHMN